MQKNFFFFFKNWGHFSWGKQWKIRTLSGYSMILRNYYYLLSRKWQNVYLSFYLHMHACVRAQSLQPCLTLWHTMDCSPPGSCVHGILQARILVWDAIPSSRGSFGPRDRTCISCISCIGRQILLPLSHLGNPLIYKPIHNFFFIVVRINDLFEFREGKFQWQTENKVENVWMKAGRMGESLILSLWGAGFKHCSWYLTKASFPEYMEVQFLDFKRGSLLII